MADPSAPALAGDVIRSARPDEIERLPDVERRAGSRFAQVGMNALLDGEPLGVEFHRQQLAHGRLWVAVTDDQVVGFAAAIEVDGRGHLQEVSVLPEHGRRGLGRRLVETALLWALRKGHPALTLSTFAEVPWNGPFYRRLGFSTISRLSSGLEELARQEREGGLEAFGERIFMLRDLTPRALEPWGWSGYFGSQLGELDSNDLVPARVVLESRGILGVVTAAGELDARVAGRLKRDRSDTAAPAIGDWVMVRLPERCDEHGLIEVVLERRSRFSRKVAGARTEEQVVAANVDLVFVVMGLDGDYNLRRLERFLVTAHRSGAEPVVVLNKLDLAEDPDGQVAAVREIAGDARVHVAAAKQGVGLEGLREQLSPGLTVALVGTSGVGKSTLVNSLYGQALMRTRKVREADDRGQHTTTHRQLVRLPDGSLLIDNPGIRELQLWEADEGMGETFADIDELASRCRFRDCRHQNEPGCAVIEAAGAGALDAGRLANYRSFVAELESLERRKDEAARLAEKQRFRTLCKAQKRHKPRSI